MLLKSIKAFSILGVFGLASACATSDAVMEDLRGAAEWTGLTAPNASQSMEQMSAGGQMDMGGQMSAGGQMSPASSINQIGQQTLFADQPTPLSAGDKFVFDNPEITWQVLGRNGNTIFWRADNGDTQVTDSNPILPTLEWKSQGRGTGKRVITGLSGQMFPLEIGKSVSFRSAVTTDKPPYSWEFTWQCTTTAQRQINTPLLGTIDAFEIVCGRQGQDELVFYYSPEVGHYVRMEASGADGYGRTIRNLIAYSRAGSSMGDTIASQAPTNQMPASQMTGAGQMTGSGMNGQPMPSIQSSMGQTGGMAGGMVGNAGQPMMQNAPVAPVESSTASLFPSEMPAGSDMQRMATGEATPLFPNANTQTPGNQSLGLQQGATGLLAGTMDGMGQAPEPSAQGAFTTPPGFDFGLGDNLSLAAPPRVNLFDPEASEPAPLPADPFEAAPEPSQGQLFNNNNLSLTGGEIMVHLASYRRYANAERGWSRLNQLYSDILSGMSPVIREVNLPEKGVFQRLFAGPVASDTQARDLCSRLQARGAYCAVMR